MESQEEILSFVGRVEFHLNGGFTKTMIWAGGPITFDLQTNGIPSEVQKIGSWLQMKLDSVKGWTVEGAGQPDPYIEAFLTGKKRPETE